MIYPICSVRDAKTSFWAPQIYQSIPSAIRDFSMTINAGSGAPAFAPGDFDFYHLGEFDSEKGTIEPVTPIEQIASGYSVFGEKYEK